MALIKRYTLLLTMVCLLLAYVLSLFFSPWTTFFHESLVFIALLLMVLLGVVCVPSWQYSRLVLCLLLVSCVPLFQWLFGLVFFAGDAL